MDRQKIIFGSLVLIVTIAILAVGYATGQGPLAVVSMGITRLTSGGPMISSRAVTEETKAATAPELASGQWINSEPLTLKSLHGRVVLIDFWTFACYNCQNTLPTVKKWDAQYRDKGLTIIGVHSKPISIRSTINMAARGE